MFVSGTVKSRACDGQTSTGMSAADDPRRPTYDVVVDAVVFCCNNSPCNNSPVDRAKGQLACVQDSGI